MNTTKETPQLENGYLQIAAYFQRGVFVPILGIYNYKKMGYYYSTRLRGEYKMNGTTRP